MHSTTALIPIRATEQLVDAINAAVELEGDAETRVAFLLGTLQKLMHRDVRCALWMLDQLERDPSPRICSRTAVLPGGAVEVGGEFVGAQQALDSAAPLTRHMLRTTLKSLRTPCTLVLSAAGDAEWFRDVMLKQYLAPTGTADCIVSMWASSCDRSVFLVVHRCEGDPQFREDETTMVSLMLRAIAPFADREMSQRAAFDQHDDLSPRERETLLMLLAGDSEKQIATRLDRSINTVHTFVKQIYRHFQVSSRGELMAQFVDQTVLDSLREKLNP